MEPGLVEANQAERYARELSAGEGHPPFLVIADIGHSLELYSEFSRSGAATCRTPTRKATASCSKTCTSPRSASD